MNASNQAMQLTASNGAAGMRATWMGRPERVSIPRGLRIKPAIYALPVTAVEGVCCLRCTEGWPQLILSLVRP